MMLETHLGFVSRAQKILEKSFPPYKPCKIVVSSLYRDEIFFFSFIPKLKEPGAIYIAGDTFSTVCL